MEEDQAAAAFDCVIVGGGPAGLTAAIYLARFHLSVAVLDDRRSRATAIPLSHNIAGHPEGIAGADLVQRMQHHARRYGTVIREERALLIRPKASGFLVETAGGMLSARKVLLATGVENLRPPLMDDSFHHEALARGLLRYCPVCDGYEVTDRRVAILGTGTHAVREAEFIRSYSAAVTLIAPYGPQAFTPEQRRTLKDWNIAAIDGPVTGYHVEGDGIAVETESGSAPFDTLYAALGTAVRSELARCAAAELSASGGILADRHQMTSVPGLYAAGDVVEGLDQIAAAMGQAAIAATAMRNAICAEQPLRRGGDRP